MIVTDGGKGLISALSLSLPFNSNTALKRPIRQGTLPIMSARKTLKPWSLIFIKYPMLQVYGKPWQQLNGSALNGRKPTPMLSTACSKTRKISLPSSMFKTLSIWTHIRTTFCQKKGNSSRWEDVQDPWASSQIKPAWKESSMPYSPTKTTNKA